MPKPELVLWVLSTVFLGAAGVWLTRIRRSQRKRIDKDQSRVRAAPRGSMIHWDGGEDVTPGEIWRHALVRIEVLEALLPLEICIYALTAFFTTLAVLRAWLLHG